MIEPVEPIVVRHTSAGEWQPVSRPVGTRFQPSLSPAFEDSSDLDIVGAHWPRKSCVDKYYRARLAPSKPNMNWTAIAEDWKVKQRLREHFAEFYRIYI
jgi:hypothetical protein